LALGGTIVYNRPAKSEPAVVAVPDNLITPEDETTESAGSENSTDNSEQTMPNETGKSNRSDAQTPSSSTAASTKATAAETKQAATIELYYKQPDDNTRFDVTNMFPGDAETKYFCVKVSYHDKVTVHYKATVRDGYEKLAEVLKVKIKLLTTGETMYDGLMKDMPKSVTYKLSSSESTTDELYYEITAYLDTSVGNEYQNKNLIADFSWWVEETGNLEPPPKTGDNANILLWACLAAASGGVIILLLFIRKRRTEEEENV
jgi:oxalate decarboxylase/phosphoglucose isomerase-like protein (cupin superfamily)